MALKRSLYIKTYGCQMNVYDSNRMADLLKPLGYITVNNPDSADMVILNTCHIREKAAEKIYSELGRLFHIKQARMGVGQTMQIAVIGCVAQAEGQEIAHRAPYVDFILGPQSYHRLPEILTRSARAKNLVLDVQFSPETKFDQPALSSFNPGCSAFLTIQEGCDKFCTFCVVPYTRGAEYSRPVEDVLLEARELVKNGVREITVLGQNVNGYSGLMAKKKWGLGRLIRALAEIEGLDRIRYTTSYPANMTKELIRAHHDVPTLMPFLHLPVQSGSNKILAAMNRQHKNDDYRRLVDALRDARPDIVLSSDFIIGFPGETENDFEQTINLVKEIGFSQAYSFKFSARPGTPAAVLPGQVLDGVKTRRLLRLQKLLRSQQARFNQDSINQVMPVLFDRLGKKKGQYLGRTPYMQAVHMFSEKNMIGKMTKVNIVKGSQNSLTGVLDDTVSSNKQDIRMTH